MGTQVQICCTMAHKYCQRSSQLECSFIMQNSADNIASIIAPYKGKPFLLNLLIPVSTEREGEGEGVC